MDKKINVEFEKEELYQIQLSVTCRLGVIGALLACATSKEEQSRLITEQAILTKEAIKIANALNLEEKKEN